MSFVIGKAEKKTIFDVETATPGPGIYELPHNHLQEHSAPFNASSIKTSTFDCPTTKYGPGSYDPVYPKNIQSDKKMKMTSSFISKVERFKTCENQESNHFEQKLHFYTEPSIKKDQYQSEAAKAKEKLIKLQEQNKKRKVESIKVNREYVRIILSNPKNTEILQSAYVNRSIIKKQNGPGSYEINQKVEKGSIDWSKNHQKRFNSLKSDIPGPGSYEFEQNPNRHMKMTSSFSYGGVRSHMEELMYKTKIPFKIKIIQEKGLRDRAPGPGEYSPKFKTSQSFHYGMDHFGSNILKSDELEVDELPGPGSYNHNILDKKGLKQMNNLIKEARKKIFGKKGTRIEKPVTLEKTNKEEIISFCQQRQKERTNFYSLKERCSSKTGTISQETRFKQPNSNGIPGPGQYKELISSGQQGIKSSFASKTRRHSSDKKLIDTPFYEITKNDIGKKALKMKRNIQNLRQIDIIKAPFNCNEKRLQVTQNIQKRRDTNQLQNDRYASLLGGIRSPAKTVIVPKNDIQQSAAFRSSTKRQTFHKTNSLGPGSYNYQNALLDKKSFNLQYNYQVPLKIRRSVKSMSSVS